MMAKQHDKQFKLDAVQHDLEHKEFGVRYCAQNLGVVQHPEEMVKGFLGI